MTKGTNHMILLSLRFKNVRDLTLHSFFLSFFLLNITCTDTQMYTQNTCFLSYKDITHMRAHTHTHTQTHTHTNIYKYIYIKLATVVEGDQKIAFSIATTPRCRGGDTPFLGLLHFTLDTYLISLSVKQGGIKYHLVWRNLGFNPSLLDHWWTL